MTNKEAAVLLVQEYANYKQAMGKYVHVQLAEAVARAVIALEKASTDEEVRSGAEHE